MRVGYAYMDNVLTPEDCSQIIKVGSTGLEHATVVKEGGSIYKEGGGISEDRKGQTYFFEKGCELDALMQRSADAMCHLAAKLLNTNLQHIEPIQFSDYKKGDHYGWHYDQVGVMADQTQHFDRHISASLELCDPETYEGGGLEFFGIGDDVPERKQGRIIVFSSMMCHRAREVTAGRRCSLVLWGRS
tara:strand:- start:313 stop:876 length:564 start_codon:yes stop_codon:yes gene_type:complete